MKIFRREFYNVSRSDTFRIVPIGDIHIGNSACDEDLLVSVVNDVKNSDNTFWIGMGDMADYIQMSDWRSDPATLADWITIHHLNDLSKAETDRVLGYLTPIAPKCLALLKGNHEELIRRKYERDIYSEIVTSIKDEAGLSGEEHLGLGYYGWMRLAFYSDGGQHLRSTIDVYLHHGFVGGKLSGSKALNMERLLWTHDADLILMGHSHNTLSLNASVESVDQYGNLKRTTRRGAFTGAFLRNADYAVKSGYLPAPVGTIEVVLQPGHIDPNKRVKVLT